MNLDILIVIIFALAGSFLSFFSGFGLGTLLLPAFMLFFPPELAITATAIVHMLNNIFKLYLVGKHADWSIVKYFGALSIVGALLGSWMLKVIPSDQVLKSYILFNKTFEITSIKVLIGLIVAGFAILETNASFKALKMDKKWMPIGGVVSGFFGGLSGHQGALRSAFLMKAGLSKEAFMGTRVVVACMVDTARIIVYSTFAFSAVGSLDKSLILIATAAAFAGAYLGNKWMQKKELDWINRFIQWTLIIFAVALILGWL
jgi:uncharacterized membrane protein YfcA